MKTIIKKIIIPHLFVCCLLLSINIPLCYGDGNALIEEIIELEIDQFGTEVDISWGSVTGATGYKLFYAIYPETDMIHYLDMGTDRSFSLELSESFAFNIAVQAFYEELEGPVSGIKSFGIQMVEKVGVDKLEDAFTLVYNYVYDLEGNLLQEKRDMNNNGVFEKTINYKYELFQGYPFVYREDFQLVEDIWLIKFFYRTTYDPDLVPGGRNSSDSRDKRTSPSKIYTSWNQRLAVGRPEDEIFDYLCVFYKTDGRLMGESYSGEGSTFYDDYGNYLNEETIHPSLYYNDYTSTYSSDYTYDENGNIIKDERNKDDDGNAEATYEYTYDDQNQKIRELIYNSNYYLHVDKSFTYDEYGRLIGEVEKNYYWFEQIIEYTYTYY